MHKDIKCVVIKPDDYEKSKNNFPVVYLLNGYSGNYAQWLRIAPQLQKKVDELHIIIVCPDGGLASWYVDSPIDSSMRYETHIIKEVIPFIDSKYKTVADKKSRAISGLSMGGHGALLLATNHVDLFGAAGSMSGGVDIRPFPDKWDISKVLGEYSKFPTYWDNYSVINVVDKLKVTDLKLIIDCGIADQFMEVNRNLHRKLLQRRIDHDFIERPGEHDAKYWSNAVDYQLLFFRKYFDSANK
ncbi:MAG: XynC protein [Bacteroidetes bacterium]|nr:MAG: XynC protein [Bacteroidota bacterium]